MVRFPSDDSHASHACLGDATSNVQSRESGWLFEGKYLLFVFGLVVEALQVWMIVEGVIAWRNARGNYPELPPLETIAAD